jgi:2-polyprenyl-3-methyl-5-hydroxy-6-metoxy-1,4-benzoquinol methylase
MYSQSSKLVQLSTIVNKEILFPKEYPYTSSTTKILRENFKELYENCKKIINISPKDLIIDIGSNDGNLLNNFKNNHKVLGITPEKIGKIAIKKGINTLIKYFDQNTANLVLKKYGKAKIITATNVFAHIENVNSLMKNLLRVLKEDRIFISESHYLVSLIKTNQYDTIYHEHLRYYSLTSLKYLFKKYGMEIIHAKKISTHGGSIRVYAALKIDLKLKKV